MNSVAEFILKLFTGWIWSWSLPFGQRVWCIVSISTRWRWFSLQNSMYR